MSVTAEQAWEVYTRARCLYPQAEVDQALDRMADEIRAKLEGSNPLVLCVMSGGVIPAGHLLTRLIFPLQVDYIHATRYRGNTEGGALHWLVRPSCSLEGRVVLIVDDIHDEGLTLAAIVDECRAAGAREVYSAVLVNKQHDRKHGAGADFVGVDTEDYYLFGYGMDYKGYLRNLPGIYAVQDD